MNDKPLLGSALTVKAPLGDNLMFHHAMDVAKPGDVIVVDGGGCCDRSLAGEIMLTYSAMKGIAGWIVDGALRDVDALRNGPIPIYCKAITPQGPYKNGPGEINVPICCGGVAVLPGDILVGDYDGVVVIRPEDAPFIIEQAEKKHADELNLLNRYYKVGLGTSHEETYVQQLTDKGCFFTK